MGHGDEIMAGGQARVHSQLTGKRVAILADNGQRRWDPLWDGLGWVVHPLEGEVDCATITNGPGCRPYIRYPFPDGGRCNYTGWRAQDYVGSIAFTNDELRFAERHADRLGPFVLVEPTIGRWSNPNKQWGWSRWQKMVNLLLAEGVTVLQAGPADVRSLAHVNRVVTANFRQAAALLAAAMSAVLPEGALHHASAALGKKPVVLFGDTVPPEMMGYPDHINITGEGGEACGMWEPCRHCDKTWETITPNHVASALMCSL